LIELAQSEAELKEQRENTEGTGAVALKAFQLIGSKQLEFALP
jgi:hypothetical protein